VDLLQPAPEVRQTHTLSLHDALPISKGLKMIRGEFAAEGRITQHLKDVHLMLEQAQRVSQDLPLLAIHADVLQACVWQGEGDLRSEEHTSELQSPDHLVCRLLLEKKK